MAAAAAPTTTEPPKTSAELPLWYSGLIGGIFVMAALAAVFYGIPKLWDSTLAPAIKPSLGELFNGALLVLAQIAAAIALCVFGSRLGGDNPPVGIRGAIFLAISTIFTVFCFARAIGMISQRLFSLDNSAALVVFLIALGGFGFLGLRFLRGGRFVRWSKGLENGGWFSTFSHKRTQGARVRRFTIIGILIILGSGVQTMLHNQHLIGMDNWDITTPFLPTIILLPDAQFTVPILMIFLSVWVAWRFVNYPPFADFLIATEAEMNKVSWSSKKSLIRDTIVVLTSLFMIAAFLFVVDIFWGWFLSRDLIGVLPKTSQYYFIEIRKLPEDKREAVAAIITEDRIGYRPETATKILEKAPLQWEEGKSEAVRLRSQVRRPDSKEDGFDDAYADRLVKRLQDAGAEVVKVRSKDQQAKLSW